MQQDSSSAGESRPDGPQPLASVIVCTYSRERLDRLSAAIDSLQQQTYGAREIIVVVDRNPELATQLQSGERPGVIVVANGEPGGLSVARNAGVRRASGDIVAFIDDDAIAGPEWLERVVAGYADEGILGVGGGVMPVWEGGEKPAWLPEEFLWTVGCSYRGLPNGGEVRNLIGCNMSFRAAVFHRVGGFDPLVGRVGSAATGCEETEFCIRALNSRPGDRIVYLPAAEVFHHVPKSRQTLRHFLRRCYAEGKSKAVVRGLAGAGALGYERTYLGTLGASVARSLRDALLLRDASGSLSRAFVTVAGVAAVASGYLLGSAQWRRGVAVERRRTGHDRPSRG